MFGLIILEVLSNLKDSIFLCLLWSRIQNCSDICIYLWWFTCGSVGIKGSLYYFTGEMSSLHGVKSREVLREGFPVFVGRRRQICRCTFPTSTLERLQVPLWTTEVISLVILVQKHSRAMQTIPYTCACPQHSPRQYTLPFCTALVHDWLPQPTQPKDGCRPLHLQF